MSKDAGGVELHEGDFVVCISVGVKKLVLGRVFKVTPKGAIIDTEIEEDIIFYDFESIPSRYEKIGVGSKRINRKSNLIYKV